MYETAASKHPAIMIHLRPIRSERAPIATKNGMPSSSAIAMMYCADVRSPSARLQIEERVELARVPHHTLTGRRAE
jgi:hypothetical protein